MFFTKVSYFSDCGYNKSFSCGSYFQTTPKFTSRIDITTKLYTVTVGYNKIYLSTPINAKQGYMIIIDFNIYSSRLASDKNSNRLYNNYKISSTNLLLTDSRFYFNCLVDRSFYIYSFNFATEPYESNGIYNISASFVNSSIYTLASISIFPSN